MGFKAKGRYLIQSVNPSGSYLRFESRKGASLTRDELCLELRRIADLIDPTLSAEEKTKRWNRSCARQVETQRPG